MCGRFTQFSPLERYTALFGAAAGVLLHPNYNVAPTQQIIVCRLSNMGWCEIWPMRWGLIPRWAKEPATGYSTINARSDTVAVKPAFRDAFRKRRCLIPTDGFYEWQSSKTRKQPYFIHRKDGEPFAFAGLYERWEREDLKIDSCTIAVTQPNRLLSAIHDRMPVIIRPEDFEQWLDPMREQDALLSLLRPYPADDLEAYPVGLAVNKPSNNDASLLERAGD
jgi:putative SOS response-associated peptidase YedK